jgi:hypothetical protein
MRILSIELNGFKRMALGDIRHFKLVPTERVQLILGTNGSGKSSLMGELTPLPAIASNYTKDGSKVIRISHRGQEYTLTSDFSQQHVHSFICSQEELNPGGTLAVQKKLVMEHFNVNQETHDLITGLERFSQMSPSRKREWLTELSDSNYDYVLGVYMRARDMLRDIQGAGKMAKKRLVAESSLIGNEEDLKRINAAIQDLIAEIDVLYQARVPQEQSVAELQAQQDRWKFDCTQLCNRLFSLSEPGARFLTPQELQSGIEETRHDITVTRTKIDVLVKEHAELKESHDACVAAGATGLEELKASLDKLRASRNQVLAERILQLEFRDPILAMQNLEANRFILEQVFSEIPENGERKYSQVNLQAAKDKSLELKDRLAKIDDNLEKLRHQKHHLDQLRNGEKTVCPKCKFTWVPGLNQATYEKIVEVIQTNVEGHATLTAELAKVGETIAENEAYGQIMREFLIIARATPSLDPFWNFLTEKDAVYTAPRTVEKYMNMLRSDLAKDEAAWQANTNILKIQELIQVAIKASDVDVAKVKTRLDSVDEELGTLSQALIRLNDKLGKQQQTLARVNEYLVLEVKIRNFQTQMETGITEMIKALRNELISDALKSLQIELAQKQKMLHDMQMQRAVVADIQEQVNKLAKDEEVHKLMVAALSPKDGLIAEGLHGFIRSFLKKMNAIIRKIWSYRLEVLDCSSGDDSPDLDYVFPMLVDKESVPDIKLGSTGIKEVVDLAFKIMATHCKGLSEASLFLDEFASSFDEQHRTNAVMAIKSIMEQLPFSQLWMVSHYHSQYGALGNAEVCVLSSTNIVVPEVYNQHVEMSSLNVAA